MGIYVNPGNENLKEALRSKIFVDKSLFICKISEFLNTQQKYVCVSRPRRFGKSMIGNLMKAYFSKGCDSREIFENLKIANLPKEDAQSENAQKNPPFDFRTNLNKFNVLSIDLGAMFSSSQDKKDILTNLKIGFLKISGKNSPISNFQNRILFQK